MPRKLDAIRQGIARNRPDAADPLDVLSKLGGFDIAGLCGVFLGGALEGLPVLMDGFISGVAALCAVRLCPAAEKAVFASHCSTEPAGEAGAGSAGQSARCSPPGMHLGEGTGAVASIPLWDMALAVYRDCYSFTEGGIDAVHPPMLTLVLGGAASGKSGYAESLVLKTRACRAITSPPCRCGMPSAPPGWRSTGGMRAGKAV